MKNINIPVSQGDLIFGLYQKSTPNADGSKKYGINVARVLEITLTFTQEINIYLDNHTYISLAEFPNYFYLTYDEAKMSCDKLNNEMENPYGEDDLEDHFSQNMNPPEEVEPDSREEKDEVVEVTEPEVIEE